MQVGLHFTVLHADIEMVYHMPALHVLFYHRQMVYHIQYTSSVPN